MKRLNRGHHVRHGEKRVIRRARVIISGLKRRIRRGLHRFHDSWARGPGSGRRTTKKRRNRTWVVAGPRPIGGT